MRDIPSRAWRVLDDFYIPPRFLDDAGGSHHAILQVTCRGKPCCPFYPSLTSSVPQIGYKLSTQPLQGTGPLVHWHITSWNQQQTDHCCIIPHYAPFTRTPPFAGSSEGHCTTTGVRTTRTPTPLPSGGPQGPFPRATTTQVPGVNRHPAGDGLHTRNQDAGI